MAGLSEFGVAISAGVDEQVTCMTPDGCDASWVQAPMPRLGSHVTLVRGRPQLHLQGCVGSR